MTTEQSEASTGKRALQDEYGRYSIAPWRLLADAAVYFGFIAWWAISSWLGAMDTDPTVGIALAGCSTILGRSGWMRASARHRWARAVALALAYFVPLVLSDSNRHGWSPIVWVQLAASIVIVATFIAVTRLKSFAPPLVDLADKPRRFQVARVWTLQERRAKLGDESELVFQNRWFTVYLTVFLSVLTLACIGLAIAAFVNGVWFGGVVLTPACGSLVYAAWRAPRVALIVDADGLTVRNVLGTQHVSWEHIRMIVAPEADWFGRLRLKLNNGASVSSGAVTNAGFRRSKRRAQVDEVVALWGPPAGE